jgi:hypothetical protein
MANILIDIEKGVEVGASDILKFITAANKELSVTPQVVAALGVVFGAVSTAVSAGESAAAASGLNIALDESEVAAVKAVWLAVVAFLSTLGVKL